VNCHATNPIYTIASDDSYRYEPGEAYAFNGFVAAEANQLQVSNQYSRTSAGSSWSDDSLYAGPSITSWSQCYFVAGGADGAHDWFYRHSEAAGVMPGMLLNPTVTRYPYSTHSVTFNSPDGTAGVANTAPTFVAAQEMDAPVTTDTALGFPAGTSAGDLVLVLIKGGNSLGTGYTRMRAWFDAGWWPVERNFGYTGSSETYVVAKFYDGSETMPDIPGTATTGHLHAVALTYSGASAVYSTGAGASALDVGSLLGYSDMRTAFNNSELLYIGAVSRMDAVNNNDGIDPALTCDRGTLRGKANSNGTASYSESAVYAWGEVIATAGAATAHTVTVTNFVATDRLGTFAIEIVGENS